MVITMKLENGAEVTVRAYKEEDAEEIVRLIARNFREVNVKDYGEEAVEEMAASHDADWFRGIARFANVYVFESGGETVGVGSIASYWGSPTESILLTIFVLPELHRKGIGSFIIDTLEKFRKKITLQRAGAEDAGLLHEMQVKAFKELLDRYQDYDTNPAGEAVEKVLYRLRQEFTYYYFICLGGRKVGAVRVVDKKEAGKNKRISPIYILPEFQGKGIAQEAVRLCEELHGNGNWELETILQEKKNCYLYEKMGYRKTGKTKEINDKLTLVFYEKQDTSPV